MFSVEDLHSQHPLVPNFQVEYLLNQAEQSDREISTPARNLLIELLTMEAGSMLALNLYLRIADHVIQARAAEETAEFDNDVTVIYDQADLEADLAEHMEPLRRYEQWLVFFGVEDTDTLNYDDEIMCFKDVLGFTFGWSKLPRFSESDKEYFEAIAKLKNAKIYPILLDLKIRLNNNPQLVRETLAQLLCLAACAVNVRKSVDYMQFRWLANDIMIKPVGDQTFSQAVNNYLNR